MIVHCTSCRAKFRIADEKIGPRGAKARCARCQTVFAVHRELGAMSLEPGTPSDAAELRGASRPSALDVDLESPERAAVPPPDPFVFPPSPERQRPVLDEADPFAAAPEQPAGDADPFAWTLPTPGAREPLGADDPFQESPDPFASADPFDVAAPGASGPPDPFAADAAAGLDSFAADAAAGPDPFPGPASFAAAPDSFAAPPPTGGRGLPLTDLSDLLGAEPAPTAPRPAPLAGPDLTLEDRATPRSVRAPGLARDLSLRDLDAPEPLFGGGPALALEREPAFAPEREPAFALQREPAFAFGAPDLDLAAERSPSGRAPLALATDPSAALSLGTEPTVAPAARPPPLPPVARP